MSREIEVVAFEVDAGATTAKSLHLSLAAQGTQAQWRDSFFVGNRMEFEDLDYAVTSTNVLTIRLPREFKPNKARTTAQVAGRTLQVEYVWF